MHRIMMLPPVMTVTDDDDNGILNVQSVKDLLTFTALIAKTSGYVLTIANIIG